MLLLLLLMSSVNFQTIEQMEQPEKVKFSSCLSTEINECLMNNKYCDLQRIKEGIRRQMWYESLKPKDNSTAMTEMQQVAAETIDKHKSILFNLGKVVMPTYTDKYEKDFALGQAQKVMDIMKKYHEVP